MDNLARVIALTVQPGQLAPCIRINRGIFVASRDANTPFNIELTVTYTSGGANVGPIVSTQTVSSTQYMQQLDAHSVRAKGQVIEIQSAPDLRTPIVCSIRVLINDATGTPVELWSADVTSHPSH